RNAEELILNKPSVSKGFCTKYEEDFGQECKKFHGEFVGRACGHHGPYVPDVLFWSVILFFSTVTLSSTLKQFKTSRYFPTKVRSVVSDFAVFLTILSMVLIDYAIGIPSPKLQVPNAFKVPQIMYECEEMLSDSVCISRYIPHKCVRRMDGRSTKISGKLAAQLDVLLTVIHRGDLVKTENKGCGYHLDLLMVAVMLGVCSIMGLPWFVAATVLSISHVNSLKLESECSAPGEQPKFLGIREQRVTGLMIFILMGSSVFLTSILKFIPMPVLYGVFLYMGASSLKGIQLFDRIKLFWMPAKHQPDFIYLRHVPLRKVHLFTIIQLSCLVLLWIIKVSRAAIVFPMMVLALVFVRKLMDFFFTKRELSWLDDLMPESKKKKLEDAEKEEEQSMLAMEEEGTVQLPLEGHYSIGERGNFVDDMREFPFAPEVLKSEKRRKLTQGKVLTGRLVYDLLFNSAQAQPCLPPSEVPRDTVTHPGQGAPSPSTPHLPAAAAKVVVPRNRGCRGEELCSEAHIPSMASMVGACSTPCAIGFLLDCRQVKKKVAMATVHPVRARSRACRGDTCYLPHKVHLQEQQRISTWPLPAMDTMPRKSDSWLERIKQSSVAICAVKLITQSSALRIHTLQRVQWKTYGNPCNEEALTYHNIASVTQGQPLFHT
ncbi:hypothetical protein EK904_003917, partial [Melospiza melodia maxima]